MREESHLEDMRSAIRGDFARLAKRRGDQELLRVSDNEEEEPDAAVEDEAAGERRLSWLGWRRPSAT